MSLPKPDGREEYNHIVHHRYLAKKRKDLDSRVRLRAILLVHEGKTLEQVGQILEVARSPAPRWIERYRRRGVTGLLVRGPYQGKKPRLSSGPETGTCHSDSTRA
ncbi:MAG: helix-turn-helix domain-containing protein [Deltaproteobacteria bacterium]|nr:helix-turn-helix domain-containing protein [Deltaproteobacteria bacterium]